MSKRQKVRTGGGLDASSTAAEENEAMELSEGELEAEEVDEREVIELDDDDDDDTYTPSARGAKRGGKRSRGGGGGRGRGRGRGRRSGATADSDADSDEEDVTVDVLDYEEDLIGSTMNQHDYSTLPLKSDHLSRPIWVCADGRVFLETYNPLYAQAYDFLIAIADPVTRPQFIHEYQISTYSLYAAASLGLNTDDIISGLQRLSKVALSQDLCDFIRLKTETCGKAKLLLKKTKYRSAAYFVESIFPETLDTLLKNPNIASARIDNRPRATAEELQAQADAAAAARKAAATSSLYADQLAAREPTKKSYTQRVVTTTAGGADDEDDVRDEATGYLVSKQDGQVLIGGSGTATSGPKIANSKEAMGIISDAAATAGNPTLTDELAPARVLSFEIDPNSVENVRKECNLMNYGMLEEYSFRFDNATPNLPVQMRGQNLRDYQTKSLSKMFGNGRARSGIIVLPCGAGKTLVGITAMYTIKKSCLIMCNTGVSVEQWKGQILKWTTLPPRNIATFTSSSKPDLTYAAKEAMVVITTYSMMADREKRSWEAERAMDFITKREWGLLLLDEVHVAPAKMFRRCISVTNSRCKLGLTATLVREDNLIDDLFSLLGPKLYEANWLDLQNAGYIATVSCVEIWCPMTAEFYAAYLTASMHKQLLLYVMNPNKFIACQKLIEYHKERKDKVLVFSDNVFALEYYAKALGELYIYGGTSDAERIECLRRFEQDPNINVLFISKIGDTSIDLPDVNVIIQISSHFSSRRQEAQRLGRILRPKTAGTNTAYFYSLVSRDTREMMYSSKRQRFLVDQGYSFKVIPHLDTSGIQKPLMQTKEEQRQMLARVLATDDSAGVEEMVEGDNFRNAQVAKNKRLAAARRTGTAAALSGLDDRAYAEFEERRDAAKQSQKSRHSLFRNRDAQLKELNKR